MTGARDSSSPLLSGQIKISKDRFWFVIVMSFILSLLKIAKFPLELAKMGVHFSLKKVETKALGGVHALPGFTSAT